MAQGMTPKLLRLVYAFEFLIAMVAIFTTWSEIGGQAALDLMHPVLKLALSFGLASAVVAYTAALVSEDSLWTLRSARWLTAIILVILAIAAVTYYYILQEDTGESDQMGTISMCLTAIAATLDCS
jgi:glucan phosphoethanolaminetransferase (alkaline phosphatase superfamily)